MKPLLLDINRKKETVGNSNPFKNHEELHPHLANLLDSSFSNMRLVWINSFMDPHGKNTIDDMVFTRFGLYIQSMEIIAGPHKERKGFLAGEAGKVGGELRYYFYPSDKKDISSKEFVKLKQEWKSKNTYVFKKDLRKFPIIEQEFKQERRMENYNGSDQPQIPYTRNYINYRATALNIYEIASYKEMMKVDNLTIMEAFVEELVIIREDLSNYVNYFENEEELIDEVDFYNMIKPNIEDSKISSKKESVNSNSDNLFLSPFKGIADIFSPLIPKFSFSNSKSSSKEVGVGFDGARDRQHNVALMKAVDDAHKAYTVFKKVNKLP
jgi:hypothetical protein